MDSCHAVYKEEKEGHLRVNKEIRARELRVISSSGEQLGVKSFIDALRLAEAEGLDLVEVVPTATPPVAKIMNYGKYRYDQTKREKVSKKSQHVIKVKEIKLGINISEHDLDIKLRQAREFIEKGFKVKVTLIFRGREVVHRSVGEKLMQRVIATFEPIAATEAPMHLLGKTLSMILAPTAKKPAK